MEGSTNMSSIIEDPEIPLVGMNGGMKKNYGSEETKQAPNSSSSHSIDKCSSQGTSGNKAKKLPKRDLENVGARLAYRKELFSRRKLIADCSLFFAMSGIILMIIDIELSMGNVYGKEGKNHISSILLKSGVSLTTAILLGFITWYHRLDVKIFMIDNSMEDWRLAMSVSRIFRIGLELIVCAIHPIPGDHDFSWATFNEKQGEAVQNTPEKVPLDVIFALPMFLRFFLVCRVLMLHSRLYQDASSQSLGALNRIHFNFGFIFKSLMNLYPEYVLTILISFLFLWASWALRACEMYHKELKHNFFNSMWLIAITFLSVGYGDITPSSYCGRGIAVLTGMFGAGCTALVVAVLARKLELSRAEKYVHNFVIDVELDKQVKHAAANVMKEGWLVYKYKKAGWHDRALKHQRRLLQATRRIRELKNDQKRLLDSGVSMVEVYRSQNHVHDCVTTISGKIKEMDIRLNQIDEKLDKLLSSKR